MTTLTKLESKIAEVLGLAMASQEAVDTVSDMLDDEHALAATLQQMRIEARETQKRVTEVAGTPTGRPPSSSATSKTSWTPRCNWPAARIPRSSTIEGPVAGTVFAPFARPAFGCRPVAGTSKSRSHDESRSPHVQARIGVHSGPTVSCCR
jgi:hypothetical protein